MKLNMNTKMTVVYRMANILVCVNDVTLIKLKGIYQTANPDIKLDKTEWSAFFAFLHKEKLEANDKPQKAVDNLLFELGIPKSN
jgi:hypothetical protein